MPRNLEPIKLDVTWETKPMNGLPLHQQIAWQNLWEERLAELRARSLLHFRTKAAEEGGR